MAFNRSRNDSHGGGPRSFGGDRGGHSGGRSGGGGYGGDRGGSRDGGALKSFDVTCARCGIATTVPFRPTGEKPVLCRNCFTNPDGGAPRGPPRAQSDRAPSGGGSTGGMSSADVRAIHEKLDRILDALGVDDKE